MKMEPIVSSETSALRTQTPGNYPKRNNLHLEHGESLRTRKLKNNEISLYPAYPGATGHAVLSTAVVLVIVWVVTCADTVITTISILLVWYGECFKQIILIQLLIIHISKIHVFKFWHQTKHKHKHTYHPVLSSQLQNKAANNLSHVILTVAKSKTPQLMFFNQIYALCSG